MGTSGEQAGTHGCASFNGACIAAYPSLRSSRGAALTAERRAAVSLSPCHEEATGIGDGIFIIGRRCANSTRCKAGRTISAGSQWSGIALIDGADSRFQRNAEGPMPSVLVSLYSFYFWFLVLLLAGRCLIICLGALSARAV